MAQAFGPFGACILTLQTPGVPKSQIPEAGTSYVWGVFYACPYYHMPPGIYLVVTPP
jgi:hypothetical protein